MNVKTLLTIFTLLGFGAQASLAQGLSASDMAFAFGGAAPPAVQEVARSAPPPVALSAQEMAETEGEVLPWAIRGAAMGTIGAAANAANAYNNGARGWRVVRAAGIGFAAGATGGVASKWLGNWGW